MATRIRRDLDNLFDLPVGANVTKTNAVYINNGNYRIEPEDNRQAYTSHKKLCIGVIQLDPNGKPTKKMYANSNYHRLFNKDMLPPPPKWADSLSVGPRLLTEAISEEYDLFNILVDVFEADNAALIMDLATYMLVEEKAVFQHYPSWARRHVVYSNVVRSDSFISEFLSEQITYSRIDLFKRKWAARHIGNGNVFFCYDSTNTNCQAEGVFLVQKGHAKDDPSLMQVNTDYVVRQEDGLPFTFMEFPGSIVDVTEASDMIEFLGQLCEGKSVKITLICDRGYISEENIKTFDKEGISFLLMLKSNMNDHRNILENHAGDVKNQYSCYMEEFDEFGKTIEGSLFDDDTVRYFHLIWNQNLEGKHRAKLLNSIKTKKNELQKAIDRKTKYTAENIKNMSSWFILNTEQAGTIKVKERGKEKTKEVPAFVITEIKENQEAISKALSECGFYILVTSEKMSALEARIAYSKRDCVEKVFQALKSSLGMDQIGVGSDDNLQGKSLIWFVAAVLHSVLFINTCSLRIKDKKSYTVPAEIDKLDAIVADRNLNTQKYVRRYTLDKKQNDIFKACKMTLERLDEIIMSIAS